MVVAVKRFLAELTLWASSRDGVRYYVDVLGFTNAEWGSRDFTCVTRDGASIYLV